MRIFKTLLLPVATVVSFCAWEIFTLTTAIPWLWGPYALAMGDAGPLFLTRGGALIIIGAGPFLAIALPIVASKNKLQWACLQLATAGFIATGFILYGYYLHSVVAWQGVENSIEYLAAEVGLNSPDDVPDHLKMAFQLSADLHDRGAATWIPGGWRNVTWPDIPK